MDKSYSIANGGCIPPAFLTPELPREHVQSTSDFVTTAASRVFQNAEFNQYSAGNEFNPFMGPSSSVSTLPSYGFNAGDSQEQTSSPPVHELTNAQEPQDDRDMSEQIHVLQHTIEKERYEFFLWKQAVERDLLIQAAENDKLRAECEAFLAKQQIEFIKLQKNILDVLEATNRSNPLYPGETG